MGGEHSGIADTTTDLFLESAFFTPTAIAGKARALGFSSDASHRYERGVDFELQRRAIERATQLIVDICGGQPGSGDRGRVAPPICRRASRCACAPRARSRCSAFRCPPTRSASCSPAWAPKVERQGDDFVVTPPSHRFDMEIEEDLIEEIARLHGYDNIPAPPPKAQLAMLPLPEDRRGADGRCATCWPSAATSKWSPISFVEAAWEADFAGNAAPIQLANPDRQPDGRDAHAP